jgi:Uma2 family endonuclease
MSAVASPSEQRIVLSDINWDTYERLLKDLEQRSAPRLTFDRGVLEIISPFSDHEEANRTLSLLVELFAEEFGIELRNLGSTTFRREEFQRGFEPDSCFYIQNEPRVRSRRRIDLTVDPPPDLVIEIDLTNSSIDKFPLFAQLGVPEVWHVSSGKVEIFTLHRDHFRQVTSSAGLPLLRAAELTELMEASVSMTRILWLRHVRQRFGNLKPPTTER